MFMCEYPYTEDHRTTPSEGPLFSSKVDEPHRKEMFSDPLNPGSGDGGCGGEEIVILASQQQQQEHQGIISPAAKELKKGESSELPVPLLISGDDGSSSREGGANFSLCASDNEDDDDADDAEDIDYAGCMSGALSLNSPLTIRTSFAT